MEGTVSPHPIVLPPGTDAGFSCMEGFAGPVPLVFDILPHTTHPQCVITPVFRGLVEFAPVAVVVVDAEGFFIYANPAAESVFGYEPAELCTMDIFDVVAAEASWVASEFEHLSRREIWSGRVSLRRKQGDVNRTTVNVYSRRLADGRAEHTALLHNTSQEGPAIARLPDALAGYGLTARDVSLLQLMAEGFADKEVAAILDTSVWTINKDVGDVLRKLDASSRTEACVKAVRGQIIV